LGRLLKVRLDAVRNGEIDPSFRDKKIIPIFFSHGLTATSRFYSQMLMDLARSGYIVFGICHQD
jgi:hypothetical protein